MSTVHAESRFEWLRKRLAAAGEVEIGTAAAALGVSGMTIRRDLAELEGLGQARRVRGGALAVGPGTFGDRQRLHGKAKARIARKLLALVPRTGAIALDASSTLARLAGMLGQAQDLTIMTNGIESFAALANKPGISPVLTGGQQEPHTGALTGSLAERAAASLHYTLFLASAAAVDSDRGSSESTLSEANIKKVFAAEADEVILAVDSSKLNTRSLAHTLDWEQVTLLVTELDRDDDRLDTLRTVTEVL